MAHLVIILIFSILALLYYLLLNAPITCDCDETIIDSHCSERKAMIMFADEPGSAERQRNIHHNSAQNDHEAKVKAVGVKGSAEQQPRAATVLYPYLVEPLLVP